ncbi:ABC transporter permease [Labilibaculum euxinus]|uniref:FtsX-like permease family protein n=1 Tax=Labilibaculum euxinus TaxID=2686357 RepID=A0A7M4DB07_9BACT|nr:ABC transporter permease [Labilibaculum euxinus]MUP39836.1 FtsX-like permease family protein [Labilibaculum euxinus]MVB09041.1 FtsX-like permease family protein [Labilibaculum euxinus]
MNIPLNLTLAIRNIFKKKTQSIISILGLGIGVGCVFLLMLLYIHENSFNGSFSNKQLLYRVLQGNDCRTSFPLASTSKDEIPLIDNYFRYYQTADVELKDSRNEIVQDHQFAFSDAGMFDCLGIRFIQGKPAQSKSEVCISETTAQKYFNSLNVCNQLLKIKLNNQFISLRITGVYKNFPTNSTFNANFTADIELTKEVLSHNQQMFGHYGQQNEEFKDWNHFPFHSYLLLNSKANPEKIVRSIQTYKERTNHEERKTMDFKLQAITDIYLKSNDVTGDTFTPSGNSKQLIYFLAIALFILLIAIVNYIFLTKAKITSRLKELGTQKALGASGISIRKQIVLESNLISFISLIPALFVVVIGIPFLNATLDRNLSMELFSMWQVWFLLIIIVLLTGSVAGLAIGIHVSKVSTVLLLLGKVSQKPKTKSWNNSFLSLHFAIFIVLVVGVLTVKKQLHYAQNNSQNINPKNIIICELNSPELRNQFDVIQTEVEKIPGVMYSAGSSFIPPFNSFLPVNLRYENESIQFDGLIMGKGMAELLELKLIEGENFGDFRTDQTEMIFNESAAKQYNLKAGEMFNGCYVKGIVKDFNAHSLRRMIQPLVILQQDPRKMRLFAIKTKGINDTAITESVQKLFKEISPDKMVRVYSLTDQITEFYQTEQQQAKLISAFSLLAIALSIMGLLGMVLNTISKKTKEIGIRKVNGAKTYEIIAMLNKGFAKWVAIAFVLACPIAWYAMHKWLENFAYKTELSWWIFAVAGLIALGIALFTVSIQSWRAATRNPVESLRYE